MQNISNVLSGDRVGLWCSQHWPHSTVFTGSTFYQRHVWQCIMWVIQSNRVSVSGKIYNSWLNLLNATFQCCKHNNQISEMGIWKPAKTTNACMAITLRSKWESMFFFFFFIIWVNWPFKLRFCISHYLVAVKRSNLSLLFRIYLILLSMCYWYLLSGPFDAHTHIHALTHRSICTFLPLLPESKHIITAFFQTSSVCCMWQILEADGAARRVYILCSYPAQTQRLWMLKSL